MDAVIPSSSAYDGDAATPEPKQAQEVAKEEEHRSQHQPPKSRRPTPPGEIDQHLHERDGQRQQEDESRFARTVAALRSYSS
jgi:hypothetical protein